MTDEELKKPTALEALLAYKQADQDGVMVVVSRQAIHEVAEQLSALRKRLDRPKVTRAQIGLAICEHHSGNIREAGRIADAIVALLRGEGK